MEQVAHLVQMANSIINEMGSLRQSVAKQVMDMEETRNTIDATVARREEVIMKAELPDLKTALIQELGAHTGATFQSYTTAIQEGIKNSAGHK